MIRTLTVGWLSISLLSLSAGCGTKKDHWNRVSVHGRVTLDGQPLAQGTISFFPIGTAGTPAGGDITNGSYSIPTHLGPVAGLNKIEIRSVQKTGRQVQPTVMPEGDFEPTQVQTVEEYLDIVPKQYNSGTKLKHDMAPGDNSLDFDLVSTPES